jgi:ParB-like chromosome segregation protein Spo0J
MVQFHSALEPLMVDIDSIRPEPDNYNNGDVELVMESIITNGMYRPVYTRKATGTIIAGNHTWLACKELGATQIPEVQLDVDEFTAIRILIADNEIARKSKPDNGQLYSLLATLQEQDSIVGTGLTETDVLTLKALNEIPLDAGDDFAQWPVITVRVPPHVRSAYMRMTEAAVGDRERFELVLRLAGWDGKK